MCRSEVKNSVIARQFNIQHVLWPNLWKMFNVFFCETTKTFALTKWNFYAFQRLIKVCCLSILTFAIPVIKLYLLKWILFQIWQLLWDKHIMPSFIWMGYNENWWSMNANDFTMFILIVRFINLWFQVSNHLSVNNVTTLP